MAGPGTRTRCKHVTNSPLSPVTPELIIFADSETLAAALAAAVAADLRAGIDARGGALLALSGGTTPRRFLQRLSEQPLDWDKVTVTLVDERWVAPDHDRSNARLLAEQLLRGAAAAAHFLPLFRDTPEPEDALAELERRFASLPAAFDAVVLGMGTDGHTASFFPGGDHLAAALDPATPARLLPMRAPGAGEARITLTLPVLLAARHLYLHIEGAAKRDVLDAALAAPDAQAPIAAVVRQAPAPVRTYWCP